MNSATTAENYRHFCSRVTDLGWLGVNPVLCFVRDSASCRQLPGGCQCGSYEPGVVGEKSPFHQLLCPNAHFRVVGVIAYFRQQPGFVSGQPQLFRITSELRVIRRESNAKYEISSYKPTTGYRPRPGSWTASARLTTGPSICVLEFEDNQLVPGKR